MKKIAFMVAGLCVSSLAVAETLPRPTFNVKCTEYKNNSSKKRKSNTLYEGPLPLGTLTMASDLAPGQHYYLTTSAQGCGSQDNTAHKEITMVPVAPAPQPGQSQGQDKGTPLPTEEPKEIFTLIPGEYSPPAAASPGQSQGKDAPIQVCTADMVDLLLKKEGAKKKHHSNHSMLNPQGSADVKIKHKTSFWASKIKAECHVEYVTR